MDVLEFGKKVAAFVLAQNKQMDDKDIVDFMMTVKMPENASLFDRVKAIIREVESFHGIQKKA